MVKRISFYQGAALDQNRFATLASFDGLDRPEEASDQFSFDVFDADGGGWRHVINEGGHGLGVSRFRPAGERPYAVAMTRSGKVFHDTVPRIEEDILPGRTDGLVCLKDIGSNLYAIGGAGHFFWRTIGGEWRILDPAFFQPNFTTTQAELNRAAGVETDDEFDALSIELESRARIAVVREKLPCYGIAGTGHDNLYLAGAHGKLLYFDGRRIERLDSGFRTTFTDVQIDDHGTVYLAGAPNGAVILKGDRMRGFTPIFQASEKQRYVYNIALFNGDIYIADVSETTGGLYRLRDGSAEHVVVPGAQNRTPVWRVDAIDGVLWVLETKALNRFDGSSWERFEYPNA